MKLEDLIGKWVIFKGERGQVVGGRGGSQASVTVKVLARPGAPQHSFVVPSERWHELEIASGRPLRHGDCDDARRASA